MINLGSDGSTMMKNGDNSYWKDKHYQDVLNSEADIVIMMFGTNDSKIYQWNEQEFHNDYKEMI